MLSGIAVTFTDILAYRGMQMELTNYLQKIVKNTCDRLEHLTSICCGYLQELSQ